MVGFKVRLFATRAARLSSIAGFSFSAYRSPEGPRPLVSRRMKARLYFWKVGAGERNRTPVLNLEASALPLSYARLSTLRPNVEVRCKNRKCAIRLPHSCQIGFNVSALTRCPVFTAQRYRIATNGYLPATAPGEVPVGFETYIMPEGWVRRTTIGGRWDVELNTFGITSALGIHFTGPEAQPDDTYMQEIDAALDDGDLATGVFQKLAADRFYFIIAE